MLSQIFLVFFLPIFIWIGFVKVTLHFFDGKLFRSNWDVPLTMLFFPWLWFVENKEEVISIFFTVLIFLFPIWITLSIILLTRIFG